MSFLESYDYLITIKHLELGKIDIWKQKDNGLLAFCKILESGTSQIELQERSNWEHENIIELLAAELHKQSNTSYISAYFEYFDFTLQDYLISQQTILSEIEVWNLLFQILSGIMFLRQKNKQTNLITTNIFYRNGQIKLIEGNSINLQKQLGLVLFEIMTHESQYIILEQDGNINELYLKKMLNECKYSIQLQQILYDLFLIINDDQIGKLYSQLLPKKNEILSLKQFKLTDYSLQERANKAIKNYKEVLKKLNQIYSL